MGVKVEAGVCRTGTPICVPSKEFIFLGICTGIQHNQKEIDSAKKGEEVCIKIEAPGGDAPKMFGRHFDEKDLLMSRVSWRRFTVGDVNSPIRFRSAERALTLVRITFVTSFRSQTGPSWWNSRKYSRFYKIQNQLGIIIEGSFGWQLVGCPM